MTGQAPLPGTLWTGQLEQHRLRASQYAHVQRSDANLSPSLDIPQKIAMTRERLHREGYTSLASPAPTPRNSSTYTRSLPVPQSHGSSAKLPSQSSTTSMADIAYKLKRAFATHDENGQPRMNTYEATIKPDGNCVVM